MESIKIIDSFKILCYGKYTFISKGESAYEINRHRSQG